MTSAHHGHFFSFIVDGAIETSVTAKAIFLDAFQVLKTVMANAKRVPFIIASNEKIEKIMAKDMGSIEFLAKNNPIVL
jgi:hypothetical protein